MLLPDTADAVELHRSRWKYLTQALSSITNGLHLPQNLTQSSEAGEGAGARVGVTAMDLECTHDALSSCRRHLVLLKGFIRGNLRSVSKYLFIRIEMTISPLRILLPLLFFEYCH